MTYIITGLNGFGICLALGVGLGLGISIGVDLWDWFSDLRRKAVSR